MVWVKVRYGQLFFEEGWGRNFFSHLRVVHDFLFWWTIACVRLIFKSQTEDLNSRKPLYDCLVMATSSEYSKNELH